MSNTSQEFWRPPSSAHSSIAAAPTANLADSCRLCKTEFIAGAGFCYVCGASRGAEVVVNSEKHVSFAGAFGFQNIKRHLGLSIPSLVGFISGGSCLLAAILVGIVVPAQNVAEYQSLHLLRIEWLLGSIAAFAAGILLKNAGHDVSTPRFFN